MTPTECYGIVITLLFSADYIRGAYDTDSNITSPNFPEPFGQIENVHYAIHIRNHDPEKYVVAHFETFDIVADPKKPDAVSLRIEDHNGDEIGTYTKEAPPGVVTLANRAGPTLNIYFRSNVDVPVNVSGFKMYFRRVNASVIEGPKVLSKNSQGSIASPGYPLYYPINYIIVYRVSTPVTDGVVQFEFEDIDLGEGAVIGVYDASSDGTSYLIYSFYRQEGRGWRYYLSGNVMTLVLKTGSRPTRRGFKLTYTEYCRAAGEELPCSLIPYSAMTNLIIFVVSITAIVACVLLLIACHVYCRR